MPTDGEWRHNLHRPAADIMRINAPVISILPTLNTGVGRALPAEGCSHLVEQPGAFGARDPVLRQHSPSRVCRQDSELTVRSLDESPPMPL